MINPLPYDLLFKNGHVIDPKNHIDGKMDVAIRDNVIAAVEADINPALAAKVVDVTGRYVTPGLIDIHVHVYHTRVPEGAPEGLSVVADAHSFRSGVTTMVDTGTAGAKHFRHFKTTCIDRQKTRIFAYINIVDGGMLGDFEQDPLQFRCEVGAGLRPAPTTQTRPYNSDPPLQLVCLLDMIVGYNPAVNLSNEHTILYSCY